ncbi:MAG: hypothetical protein AAFO04_01360 [Cyanobacteria bacterium J06592_8]
MILCNRTDYKSFPGVAGFLDGRRFKYAEVAIALSFIQAIAV